MLVRLSHNTERNYVLDVFGDVRTGFDDTQKHIEVLEGLVLIVYLSFDDNTRELDRCTDASEDGAARGELGKPLVCGRDRMLWGVVFLLGHSKSFVQKAAGRDVDRELVEELFWEDIQHSRVLF